MGTSPSALGPSSNGHIEPGALHHISSTDHAVSPLRQGVATSEADELLQSKLSLLFGFCVMLFGAAFSLVVPQGLSVRVLRDVGLVTAAIASALCLSAVFLPRLAGLHHDFRRGWIFWFIVATSFFLALVAMVMIVVAKIAE